MAAAASGWQWLARVDGAVYDHALRHGWREAPRDIVIVAIDDDSLQAIGPWPWRRAIHAEAVKQAHARGARSVLLNLLLTESDPNQDAALPNWSPPSSPTGATWQRASEWLIPYLPRDQRIPQVSYAELLLGEVPDGLFLG